MSVAIKYNVIWCIIMVNGFKLSDNLAKNQSIKTIIITHNQSQNTQKQSNTQNIQKIYRK